MVTAVTDGRTDHGTRNTNGTTVDGNVGDGRDDGDSMCVIRGTLNEEIDDSGGGDNGVRTEIFATASCLWPRSRCRAVAVVSQSRNLWRHTLCVARVCLHAIITVFVNVRFSKLYFVSETGLPLQ